MPFAIPIGTCNLSIKWSPGVSDFFKQKSLIQDAFYEDLTIREASLFMCQGGGGILTLMSRY